MVRQLICDKCKEVIPNKSDYIKLQMIKHEGKKQEYNGVGHICMTCFKEIIK